MAKLIISLCAVALVGFVQAADVITSPKVTDWGEWADDFERCPEGRAAQGFQLQTEAWVGPIVDDTSLNGIKLFCGNPSDGVTPTITSNVGNWGDWGKKFRCSSQGYVTGFSLRVEAAGLAQDETATNNVRIYCSKNEGEPLEGDGTGFGSWGDKIESCPVGQVVCGIKTQIQEDQGNIRDDTALNNVAMECCPNPDP